MNIDYTLVERPTVYGNVDGYSVAEVIIPNAVTEVASGAGESVTTTFAFSQNNLPADLNYCVEAIPSQPCAVSYDNKAITGFDIILTPLSAGVTLAAGTIDVIVTWSRG